MAGGHRSGMEIQARSVWRSNQRIYYPMVVRGQQEERQSIQAVLQVLPVSLWLSAHWRKGSPAVLPWWQETTRNDHHCCHEKWLFRGSHSGLPQLDKSQEVFFGSWGRSEAKSWHCWVCGQDRRNVIVRGWIGECWWRSEGKQGKGRQERASPPWAGQEKDHKAKGICNEEEGKTEEERLGHQARY